MDGRLVDFSKDLEATKAIERAAYLYYDRTGVPAKILLVPERTIVDMCKSMGLPILVDEFFHLGIHVRETPMREGHAYAMEKEPDYVMVSAAVRLGIDSSVDASYWELFGYQTDYGVPAYGWPTILGQQCFGILAYDNGAAEDFIMEAKARGFNTTYGKYIQK